MALIKNFSGTRLLILHGITANGFYYPFGDHLTSDGFISCANALYEVGCTRSLQLEPPRHEGDDMLENGTQVKVHYKGTLTDGTVFDSSEGREPLVFEIGAGQVIAGFDKAVMDMEVGAIKTVNIPCVEAYGEIREDMVGIIPSSNIPEELNPQVGQMLQVETPQGALPVKVLEVNDEGVKIDGNHPLAGEDLTFELTLVEAV